VPDLHGAAADIGDLAQRVAALIGDRLLDPPLGRTATPREMQSALAGCITPEGLGIERSWEVFERSVLANTIGIDGERFLAFIPSSPAASAAWIDAVVGATCMPAESWMEASGAVAAENQVLDLLASLVGLPPSAGGCFISGGSIGNLSALAVARDQRPSRRVVAVADTVHASVANTLHLLGLEPLTIATAEDGRFTASALRSELRGRGDVGTIVASAGSTNAGVIDDLDGLADVAAEIDAWFHVDAAYGGAVLLLPEFRERLRGMSRADSFIIDPHKWLFAPSGSCALLYREPELARAVHTQRGPYIDIFRADGDEWNPADFGFQLTRRASGIPLWFSLVLHGTRTFESNIRAGIELARLAAESLADTRHVSLVMEPELSVVLFRRDGWGRDEWRRWARRLLDEGIAFVAPTTWRGEPVGRLVFMHPLTSPELVFKIVSTLSG